jgi:hypothetical protein
MQNTKAVFTNVVKGGFSEVHIHYPAQPHPYADGEWPIARLAAYCQHKILESGE